MAGPLLSTVTVFFNGLPALIDCNNKPLPSPLESDDDAAGGLNTGGGGGGGEGIFTEWFIPHLKKVFVS